MLSIALGGLRFEQTLLFATGALTIRQLAEVFGFRVLGPRADPGVESGFKRVRVPMAGFLYSADAQSSPFGEKYFRPSPMCPSTQEPRP